MIYQKGRADQFNKRAGQFKLKLRAGQFEAELSSCTGVAVVALHGAAIIHQLLDRSIGASSFSFTISLTFSFGCHG